MIIFCGDNSFFSWEAALAEVSSNLSGRELVNIDGEEVSELSIIRHHLGSSDLFGNSAFVFIKRPSTKLLSQIAADPKLIACENLVIWHSAKLDGRANYSKTLAPYTKVFEPLAKFKLTQWCKERASKSYGINLTTNQAQLIVQRAQDNLWIIDSEMAKISAVAGKLTDQLLTQLVADYSEQSIWQLLDSLLSKSKFIKLLATQLEGGVDPYYIIAMVEREIRLISSVKYADEHKEPIKLHPFVLEKTMKKVHQFSWQRLKQAYLNILTIDTKLKNGELYPNAALLASLWQI